MMTIVLTGDRRLNRKLRRLSGKEHVVIVKRASKLALKPMLLQAQINSPIRTGRLRKSLRIRAMRRSRTMIGSRVTTGKHAHEFKGRTFYGGFQEYGWHSGRRTTNADLGLPRGAPRTESEQAEAANRDGRRKYNEPRKFMKRAARSKRRRTLREYRKQLRTAVLKAFT